MTKKSSDSTDIRKLSQPTLQEEDVTSVKIKKEPVRPPRPNIVIKEQSGESQSSQNVKEGDQHVRIPSVKITNPNNQSSAKVSYANEKSPRVEISGSDKSPQPRSQTFKKENSPTSDMNNTVPKTTNRSSQNQDTNNKHPTLFEDKVYTHTNTPIIQIPKSLTKSTLHTTIPMSNFDSPITGRRTMDESTAGRTAPRHSPYEGGAGAQSRPCPHHSFLTDAQDVRQIEQGLLQLMEDFQQGNLSAFGKDSRLRQMEEIREQQEKLAKKHLDVGAEQDLLNPLSEDGLRATELNMRSLIENLATLSTNIENLHTDTNPSAKNTSEKDTAKAQKAEKESNRRNSSDKTTPKPPEKPARKSVTSSTSINNDVSGHLRSSGEGSQPPSSTPPILRTHSRDIVKPNS